MRTFCLISALSLLLLASHAQAQNNCPANGADGRKRIISEAKTCTAAGRLYQRCSQFTSLNLSLAKIVTEKCEQEFVVKKVSKARLAKYHRAIDACNKSKGRGTGARSAAAGCRVRAALRTASGR